MVLARCTWLAALLGLLAFLSPARAANFVDHFADRQLLSGRSGLLVGNNADASLDKGEPVSDLPVSRRSVWVSWIAPANGMLSLDTDGSGFDTVLSVYTLETPGTTGNSESFQALQRIVENDDSEAGQSSSVQTAVRAGRRYEISVDGFGGGAGVFRLKWEFVASETKVPVLVRSYSDQAVKLGGTASLSISVQADGRPSLQWFLNGEEVPGATSSTLMISNVQPEDAGRYTLHLVSGDYRMVSEPIEVQINTEGDSSALARDRMLDAPYSLLRGRADSNALAPEVATGRRSQLRPLTLPIGGLARGYNGSQIFNTTFAGHDAGEPDHCGVSGGASYWFAYQPPVDGTLTVDTDGSSFDTVLAAYTYDPPLGGYSSLVSVGCDDNGGTGGGASRLSLATSSNRVYLIVVDGVGGARGLAKLHYVMTPTPPAPQLAVGLASPASGAVFAASAVVPLVAAVSPATNIARVEFFADGNLLATTTSVPFSTSAVGLPSGSHNISAKATDLEGHEATSLAVTILVETPPPPPVLEVQLTEPVDAAVFLSPARVPLTAVVSADQVVAKVEFFVDDTLLSTVTHAPFATKAEALTPGSHTIYATATDVTGNTANSLSATVQVVETSPPPLVVSLREPVDGESYFSPAEVPLAIEASALERVASVDYFYGETLLDATTNAPFNGVALGLPVGSYTVFAKVTEIDGTLLVTLPATVTVTAAPALPLSVSLTSPVNGASYVAPAAVPVVATVTPADGVSGVRFFADEALVGEVTNAPFSLTLSDLEVGTHVLKAKVADRMGNTANSLSITVTVNYPPPLPPAPVITQHPASVASMVGGSVVLRAGASADPPTIYQWLKDGAPLISQNQPTLTIPQVTLEHAGAYVLEVSNPGGRVKSRAAKLAVVGPLSITLEDQHWSVFVSFASVGAFRYSIESAEAITPSMWVPWVSAVANHHDVVSVTNRWENAANRFFRLRLE